MFSGLDVNGDQFPFSDRVGTIGWNTYPGATDLRLQRVFNLGERLKAEASAEIFSLFNWQNLNGIDTVYGAPTFLGPVPRQSGDGVTSLANLTFGTPNYVAPARQVQLVLRLNS